MAICCENEQHQRTSLHHSSRILTSKEKNTSTSEKLVLQGVYIGTLKYSGSKTLCKATYIFIALICNHSRIALPIFDPVSLEKLCYHYYQGTVNK